VAEVWPQLGTLEELMKSGKYEYQSEFARKYVAQGRQEGEADAVLEVLDARGLKVDAEARRRILACTDLAQLKAWLRKAITVLSVQELFEASPTS
jgi:Arc/MetJ-type ribon-helix-helix transcriptional regulator